MRQIVRIGLDIAKRWCQIRGVDETDKEVFNRKRHGDRTYQIACHPIAL